MKRLFVILSCLLISGISAESLFAQSGIEIGYLSSSYRTKSGDNTSTSDALNGFHVTATRDIRLIKGLSLQPGLSYSFLTRSEDEDIMGFEAKASQSEHYLGIPVRFQYKFDVVPSVLSVYAFTGPTFDFGLAGKTKMEISGSLLGNNINGDFSYDYFSNKIKSNNLSDEIVEKLNENLGNSQMNRFDIHYGVGAGVCLFDLVEVRGGYDWGLLNRFKDSSENMTTKRNQFYVSVGIRF